MAVHIRSGASTDEATVDPTSKALRVTNYLADGSVHDTSVPTSLTVNNVTVAGNDLIASVDVSNKAYVSLQITGTFAGATIVFQGSNDNGTFDDVVSQDIGEITAPYVSSATTVGLYKIPTPFKYLRVRVTAIASGTISGNAEAFREDSNTGQISATGEVSLAAGSSTIGKVEITSNGTMVHTNVISAVGTNATVMSAYPSTMWNLHIVSAAATPRFVKFYDMTTTPVVGTTVPFFVVSLSVGASPFSVPVFEGIDFPNGIAYSIQLGVSNSDSTPFTVAGEVVFLASWKLN
jgi:hypothetical protein